MRQFIKKLIVIFYRMMAHVLPLRKNLIIFNSNLGKNYSGNPRALYEELSSSALSKYYKCVWCFNSTYMKSIREDDADAPDGAVIVTYGRLRYYYCMARASYWIFDSRQEDYLIKRKGVRYLQTWHGTPLKRLGLDIEHFSMAGETNVTKYREDIRRNSATWDILLAQNEFSKEVFGRCFAFDKELPVTGYPRNDILFSQEKDRIISDMRRRLNIPEGKKVMLYAPTWRDDKYLGQGWYKFESGLDMHLLEERFGDEWVIAVKGHYLVKGVDAAVSGQEGSDAGAAADGKTGFVRVCDSGWDIGPLYLLADIMITDYSSVMFDYSVTGKPMFFCVYDYDDYENQQRGFYFNMRDEVPGPVVSTTEELADAISSYDGDTWKETYRNFQARYNPLDDGNASARVLAKLLN